MVIRRKDVSNRPIPGNRPNFIICFDFYSVSDRNTHEADASDSQIARNVKIEGKIIIIAKERLNKYGALLN